MNTHLTPFAELLYTMQQSTHGVTGINGGKGKYPLNTSQKSGQRVILTNGELAEVLSALPEKKREIIYLYFFGHYTQQEIGELYGRCRSTAWHHIHSALQMLHEEMEVLFREES